MSGLDLSQNRDAQYSEGDQIIHISKPCHVYNVQCTSELSQKVCLCAYMGAFVTVSIGNPIVITHTVQWQELLWCPDTILADRSSFSTNHQTRPFNRHLPLSSSPCPGLQGFVFVDIKGGSAISPICGDRVSFWRPISCERLASVYASIGAVKGSLYMYVHFLLLYYSFCTNVFLLQYSHEMSKL